MRTLAGILSAVLALGGCDSGDSPPAPRYTCDASATAVLQCSEFGPMDDYGVNYNAWLCGTWGGVWGADLACPTEGLVASCSSPPDRGGTRAYFYEGTQNLVDLERTCTTNGGTFTTYP